MVTQVQHFVVGDSRLVPVASPDWTDVSGIAAALFSPSLAARGGGCFHAGCTVISGESGKVIFKKPEMCF